jgi:hypothetical protein
MKKIIAVLAIALPLAFSARAQLVVYDPVMNVEQILDQAANLAKYIQMIENQVQQITTLTDQLNEFKHYEDLFGDPQTIALPTLAALNTDLQQVELGVNLDSLLSLANGAAALTNTVNGIFTAVGASFQTPDGQTIMRPAAEFKPFAALTRTADNFIAVANDAAARRTAIKNQIAQTTTQLKNATTDAEVQKLQGILTGLNGDLSGTEAEVNQAIGSALVQDIQNRNEESKQQLALREQSDAEFHEAVTNYTAKFTLLNEPTLFPTP